MNIKYGNCFLGKTLILYDNFVEVEVTLDVGPRIIGFRPINGFDVMFKDETDKVNHDCSNLYGKGEKWHLYGGHRLWLAPEDESTYYPDNSPITYETNAKSVTFTSCKRKNVEVATAISVTFIGNGEIEVTHYVKNLGKKRTFSLWALTALKSGGTLTIPFSAENTGYLPNRNIVMWHYSSFSDSRLNIENDKITVKSDVGIPKPFKLGTFCKDLRVSYELENHGEKQTFIKAVTCAQNGLFPDFNCNMETYCSHLIHEIETLSAFKELDTEETLTHTERWSVIKTSKLKTDKRSI